MSIWSRPISVDSINLKNENTLVSHLNIKITAVGENFLEGTMPVDHRTIQPFKLLHGGASCVLAETLGSIAANFCIDANESMAVGQHIEATHLKSASKGFVRGRAMPLHLGKKSQTWRIEIYNDEGALICDSKIIMAVIKKR